MNKCCVCVCVCVNTQSERFSTEATLNRPVQCGDAFAQGGRQQTWGVIRQVLVVSLLLRGLHMGTRGPLKVDEESRVTDSHRSFSFARDLSSVHHKTTVKWELNMTEEGMSRGFGDRQS